MASTTTHVVDRWSAKLTVAYHGANYVGWQVQPNGESVQQVLEQAWHGITGERLRITASGRTDSGVHALGQVCSCHTQTRLAPHSLKRGLNAKTPIDISVVDVVRAAPGFHAIRDAVSKTYLYRIQTDAMLSPFEHNRSWHVPRPLDLQAMHLAAEFLRGTHDFSCFESAGSARRNKVRTLAELQFVHHEEGPFHFLVIKMTADGFLFNMARNIVGTLVEVGRGKRAAHAMSELLATRDRRMAGVTAPPHGLYLWSVDYPPHHLPDHPSDDVESPARRTV
ncbi:MAG TPA: tRNA pseudouridine(38-40) synthase TruA [Pirellulaceae bacterium]|nr:tRNA pseudouridine(38-40) synthase TruA [Pirellulaceae bacterium]HMO92836.1 tRNA pseudouridine(38-40) synthase TruA [Pirellulaceae bacterium]HMP69422.1 tRNA pseudouridine(38-40) synthase TruA [Pirellulaceae bacterium]